MQVSKITLVFLFFASLACGNAVVPPVCEVFAWRVSLTGKRIEKRKVVIPVAPNHVLAPVHTPESKWPEQSVDVPGTDMNVIRAQYTNDEQTMHAIFLTRGYGNKVGVFYGPASSFNFDKAEIVPPLVTSGDWTLTLSCSSDVVKDTFENMSCQGTPGYAETEKNEDNPLASLWFEADRQQPNFQYDQQYVEFQIHFVENFPREIGLAFFASDNVVSANQVCRGTN